MVNTTNDGKHVVMLLSNAYNPDDRVRNEALALLANNYDVTVVAWDRFLSNPQTETIEGMVVKRVRLKAGYGQGIGKFLSYGFIWFLFLNETNKLKPDIIHCHDFDTYFVGLLYKAWHKKTKLIFDAHENYAAMMCPLVSGFVYKIIATMEKLLTPKADLVIGSCDANVIHYRDYGAKKAVVVGNWKDPKLFAFSPDQIKAKRKELLVDDRIVFTYIGSITEDRNVIPLIRAVKQRPWAFVIIGGTGGQESEIRTLCADMPNAYFPGYIHPDQVPLFTALSDVIYYGLSPSDDYAPYNAPNKLYEALAAGKPMLAADLGGEISNIVKSIDCGFLLNQINMDTIGTAMDKLSNPNTRRKLGNNSRIAGETLLNWKLASRKLISAYEEM